MTVPLDALDAAGQLRDRYAGATGYGLVYGSHATRGGNPGSDLDLLLVAPQPLAPELKTSLIQDVKDLHARFALRSDEEVAYDVKLFATAADVHDAIALRGLHVTAHGSVTVPRLVAESGFLNSPPFRMRLILNALTVAHVFLGGDMQLYQRHRAQAERSVALLALSLTGHHETTVRGLCDAVTRDAATGLAGEDYLGYQPGDPAVFGMMHHGLAQLASESAVTARGVRFEPDTAACLELVRELNGGPPEQSSGYMRAGA